MLTDIQSLGEQELEYVPDTGPPPVVPQALASSADSDITDSLIADIVGGDSSGEEEGKAGMAAFI